MKKFTMIAATGVTSVAMAAAVVSPAFAWHPKGQIVKSVQNVTTKSAMSDANNAATAVAAKPGDTLKYTIVVSNTADNDGSNDMAFTVLKDTLPAGVEMVSNASQRTITEDLGTIKPGKSVTKEYLVKVTAQKDGIIENKACFTGDSEVKDNLQNGCDVANVKVTVPPVVVTPPTPAPVTPVSAPVTPVAPAAPVELPKTGPANIIMLGGAAVVVGYALNLMRLKFLRANQ
jgi:uncharacterized repeat protein (TIGR01451 family)